MTVTPPCIGIGEAKSGEKFSYIFSSPAAALSLRDKFVRVLRCLVLEDTPEGREGSYDQSGLARLNAGDPRLEKFDTHVFKVVKFDIGNTELMKPNTIDTG
ncbi:unnamed protein product, partial [Heterotrigona itama]